jgi:glycosyltransferase involved in cell wall biosynthesis
VSSILKGERSVVLLSAHPWDGNPYGLHHIAQAIAKTGAQVLFVEPPFSPLHLFAKRRRGRVMSRRLRPSGEENIFLFSPFSLLPYLKFPGLGSGLVLKCWPRFVLNRLGAAVRRTPFEHPGLLICGASLFSSITFDMKADVRAFRLADDERLFDTVPASMRAQTMLDLARYEVVFTTSTPLAHIAKVNGARRVIRLPNGVDTARFAAPHAIPDDLAALPSPRVIYVGALESWFDWEALAHAAAVMPQVSFAVIGEGVRVPAALPANVLLLGLRPHSEISAYLAHCDVGIIPFRQDKGMTGLHAVDPIKLWEYLASGLPVVASANLALPDLPASIQTYSTHSQFAGALSSAITAGRQAVSQEVQQRSWAKIVENALKEAASQPLFSNVQDSG